MATILGKGIQDGGATAKVVSVEDIKADDLKDYPVFALGCHPWEMKHLRKL